MAKRKRLVHKFFLHTDFYHRKGARSPPLIQIIQHRGQFTWLKIHLWLYDNVTTL